MVKGGSNFNSSNAPFLFHEFQSYPVPNTILTGFLNFEKNINCAQKTFFFHYEMVKCTNVLGQEKVEVSQSASILYSLLLVTLFLPCTSALCWSLKLGMLSFCGFRTSSDEAYDFLFQDWTCVQHLHFLPMLLSYSLWWFSWYSYAYCNFKILLTAVWGNWRERRDARQICNDLCEIIPLLKIQLLFLCNVCQLHQI